MTYRADPARYDTMQFRNTGKWGLKLPAISLGLWQNFGGNRDYPSRLRDPRLCLRPRHHPLRSRQQLRPAPGRRGRAVRPGDGARLPPLSRRADHLVQGRLGHVAGPLRRFRLAQIPDRQRRAEPQAHGARLRRYLLFPPLRPDTPLEETMGALEHLYRSGKALYVGISSYPAEQTRRGPHASSRSMGVPLLIHQPSYSILNRWIEDETTPSAPAASSASASSPFSPLAQGILSGKYIARRTKGTRAAEKNSSINRDGAGAECAEGASTPSARSPRSAARRWSSWRWPGCCGARK